MTPDGRRRRHELERLDRQQAARREVTWNICPSCGHRWTDRVPTRGVRQRSTPCTACRRLAKAEGTD
jgi:hypothetical protein